MTDDGWGLLVSTNYEVLSTVRAGVSWMAGVPMLFLFFATLRLNDYGLQMTDDGWGLLVSSND